MRAKHLFIVVFVAAFVIGFIGLLWYLAQEQGVAIFLPRGPIALEERNLIFISVALMLSVVVPVLMLTAFVAWRYRATNHHATYLPNWDHNVVEEFVWWAVPCVIVLFLSSLAWRTSHSLDPFRPLADDPLIIEVVSLDWKWLFIYPEENIATVNFVEFPTNRAVEFHLTSDSPMNSFWIPQLAGQIYTMTGMVTKLSLRADVEGDYHGSAANITGKGFAGMKFTAKAVSEQEFHLWIASTSRSSIVLDTMMYETLSQPSMYEPVRYYIQVTPGLFDFVVSKYTSSSARSHLH